MVVGTEITDMIRTTKFLNITKLFSIFFFIHIFYFSFSYFPLTNQNDIDYFLFEQVDHNSPGPKE